MVVVYDHQIFCWQEYGGISRYFFELAKRVGQSRHFSASIVAPLHVNSYIDQKGVKVHGIRIPKLKNSGRILDFVDSLICPTIVRKMKPDLLHETYYSKKGFSPKGCPTVLTVFDMTHEKYPGEFLSRDNTSELKKAAVNRADHIICISENTRRDMIEILNVPSEKTSVVHLGYSLVDDSAHNDIAISQPYLLYVGPRGAYKNFGKLLEAFASSPHLRHNFRLVAFGGGKFSAQELEKIDYLKVEGSVIHESGNDAKLAAFYRNATAFVYPSLYEGFGIPLLEAMSLDCPVICSKASSFPEIAGSAACYFDPSDTGSIREAIEKVISLEDRRSVLIQEGRARCRQFSWDRTAIETMEIYKKAIQ